MAKNEVTLDLVIRTLVDGNTKNKAKQQGEDFASEYQKALEAVLKLAKSNDFTLDAKIGKDVLKQLDELSKQTDKTLKTQIEKAKGYLDQWVKYQSNIPSLDLFGKVNANKPKTDKKGSTNSDNVTPTVNFKGLDEGLQKAEKGLDSFLEKFKKFCAALQTEANKTIKLKGLSDGIAEGKKAIGEASKVKLKFDGINEGVNSAKSKLQELVDFFKEKIALLPKIASTRISFKGLDTGVKTKIADILQGANKAFDAFSKKATEMPQKFDAAVSKLATSLAKLEAGINGLIVVFSSASTKITANIENIPQAFNKLQDAIKLTSKMLRDMGKNAGKNVTTQLRQISNEIKSFGTSISNLGSAIPNKLVNSLNQVASAIGKMESLVIRLNNTFKNFDTKPFDNVKNKIKDIEKLFSTINGLASNLGKNAGSPMYSALSGIQKKLHGVITLLREAQKEAANFGNAFSGNYLASLNQLRSALNGIHARLRVIGRMTFPNIPNVPNVPNAPNTPNVPNAPNQPRRQSGGGTSSNNAVTGFGGAIKKATGALSSFYDSIIKFNVMYYGIPNILNTLTAPFQSGFEYQKTMETSKLGIAGILTQMGKVDGEKLTFQDSLGVAEGILQRLNLQAIKTAASTQDLVDTFRGLAAPGLGAGFNVEQLEKFTVVGVNAAKAMNLDSRQFVQELRDLVQGGIQPASSTIATSLGLTDADIKAMKESSKGLFASLMEYMEGFSQSAEAYPKTFAGMIDQISEYGTLASAEFTKAFEPEIKNLMQIIQNLFGEIKMDENGIPIKFEINPAILTFINAIHTGIKQVTVLWNELLSSIGSFDDNGKFIISEEGVRLLESAKEFVKAIWADVLLLFNQLVIISPVVVNIMTTVFQIATYIAQALGFVTELFSPLSWIAKHWDDIKGKVYAVVFFVAVLRSYINAILALNAFITMAKNAGVLATVLRAIIPIMNILISKSKALAAWNAMASLAQAMAQNPKATLAGLGIAAGTVVSAEIGARLAGGSLMETLKAIGDKISSFADEVTGNVDAKLPDIPDIPDSGSGSTVSTIDPANITGTPKVPDGKEAQRAADKAEKDRLKLAKKALKEMLAMIKANCKDQLDLIKSAVEDNDLLYEQNAIGIQEYFTNKALYQAKSDQTNVDSLKAQIKAIEESDSFETEEERQTQLAPLNEQLKEMQRSFDKSSASMDDVARVFSDAIISIEELTAVIQNKKNKTDSDNNNKKNPWTPPAKKQGIGRGDLPKTGIVDLNGVNSNVYNSGTQKDQYKNEIIRVAIEHKVDPALALSIAETESKFNQSVVSSAGAIGIMQLMPDTASGLGVNPYDWKQNILGGIKYIKQMLDKFNNDALKAVAAYNAGPGAVGKIGGVPNYKETQNYVDKVGKAYPSYANQLAPVIKAVSKVEKKIPDISNETFYTVARGREGQVDGGKDKNKGLTHDMWVKMQLFFKAIQDEYKPVLKEKYTKPNIIEGRASYSTGLNASGDAVDFTLDWAKNDEKIRKNLKSIAEQFDLFLYDQYKDIKSKDSGRIVKGQNKIHISNNRKVSADELEKNYATKDIKVQKTLRSKLAIEANKAISDFYNVVYDVSEKYFSRIGDFNSYENVKINRFNDEKYGNSPNKETRKKIKANSHPADKDALLRYVDKLEELEKLDISFDIESRVIDSYYNQLKTFYEMVLPYLPDKNDSNTSVSSMYFGGKLNPKEKIGKVNDAFYNYFKKSLKTFDELETAYRRSGDLSKTGEVKEKVKKIKETIEAIFDKILQNIKDISDFKTSYIDANYKYTEGQKEQLKSQVNVEALRGQLDAKTEKYRKDVSLNEEELVNTNQKLIAATENKINILSKISQKEAELEKFLNDSKGTTNTANVEKEAKEKRLEIQYLNESLINAKKEINNLKQVYDKLSINPELTAQLREITLLEKQLEAETVKMQKGLKGVWQAAKQALEDGLVTFLTDGVNECETLAEALNNLVVSILKTMQKKFAENMVNDLMNAWFPDDSNGSAASQADFALQGLAASATYTADSLKVLAMYLSTLNPGEDKAVPIKYSDDDLGYTVSAGDDDTTLKVDTAQTEQSMITLSAGATEANTSVGMFSSTLSTEMTTIQGALTEFTTNVQNAASSLLSIGSGGGGSGVQQNANGGYISGPGTGTSDSILSRLSNGEFVVKAASVRKYGTSMLERINNGTFSNVRVALPAFASGGYVGSLVGAGDGIADRLSQSFSSNVSVTNYVDGTKMVNPEVIKTIVRKVNLQDAKRNSQIMSRFK